MRTELLAPAGSAEALKAVVNAGADAVYIGASRFGARAYADNPGAEELIAGMDYAHLRGARVYLTVNTLLKDRELEELCAFLSPYVAAGVDAVLVQDFGVLKLMHEIFPSLPLHASTQMTVTGPLWPAYLRRYGVTRVVPARELSLRELIRIREESGLEVETFIHGALCYCYSGQCLLSSMIGGRSGNRGRCAQPCRLLNLLDDRKGFDGRSSILDRPDARHFLSPKDLCAAPLIGELVRAGIDSLKIEGRMKQPEYAAGVVSVYRELLDAAEADPEHFRVREDHKKMLYDLYNRSGFTDGYFHRQNGPEMMALLKHELTAEETAARHALYSEMRSRYMDKQKDVPVSATFRVKAGEPLSAEVRSGRFSARVTGDPVEPARRQPLSEGKIREQVSKTGGSDFVMTEVSVETDGAGFVPVSALNELRRRALAALRENMLGELRRTDVEPCGPAAPLPGEEKDPKEDALSGSGEAVKRPELTALVATEEQLDAALAEDAVSLIYAEAALLFTEHDAVSAALRFIRRAAEAGKKSGIAMPRVDREDRNAARFLTASDRLLAAGLSVYLLRTPESLAAFMEKGLASHVRADASLYAMNRGAKAFLRECGVAYDTAPLELNRKELRARDNRGSEVIVYAYLPLMLSAQCLKKNTDACTKKNARMKLTDRTGATFTVRCECVFCYNILYNELPMSLLREMDELRNMGFSSMRVELSLESGKEAERILSSAASLAAGGSAEPAGMYTRGHYLRGVE